MPQPAQVALEERPQIRNPVFQHRDPVDTHAEGEALPLGGVDPPRLQHLGMDHAGAEDLQPAFPLPDLQLAAGPVAADVDLGRGLGEGEMRGAEAQLDLIDLEEGAAELFQRPFQVGHRDVLPDRQPLDLVEHGRVGLVHVHAVDAAGADDAQGRAHRFHRADLDGRGMGAQDMGRAGVACRPRHEEGVV